MALPYPRPVPARRVHRFAGVVVCLFCMGVCASAVADPLPAAGSAPPRSRLYVRIPGYTAYYVPPDAATAPAPPAPTAHEPSPAAPLVAAAESGVDDATAGLVIGYAPGSLGVAPAAGAELDELARRMRHEPTMIIALDGFAGGGDALRARRLALWRARAVRTRLIEDGVDSQRIRLRAADADGGLAPERVDVRIVQP
ncbi:MAG: hypothetical protein U1E66_07810 [Rhodospirillales bacterium]